MAPSDHSRSRINLINLCSIQEYPHLTNNELMRKFLDPGRTSKDGPGSRKVKNWQVRVPGLQKGPIIDL